MPDSRVAARSPLNPTVVSSHQWLGYRCESRLVRASARHIAPVVLIGGAFQTKEGWGRLEREFLAHADVFTVDLPGWGSGSVLPDNYAADFLADALCHMLDETGLPPANIMGGSYGTAIVYNFAQRYPERVKNMALVGTMTSIPANSRIDMRRILDLLAERRVPEFADELLKLLMNEEKISSVASGEAVRQKLLRRMHNLTAEEIEQFFTNTQRLLKHEMIDRSRPPTMPALVVTGEHDVFTTPDLCRDLAATCADSWFVSVADADHLLHLERTVELVDLVMRFYVGEPLTGLGYCRSVERITPLERAPAR
jgi:pimeloyl-ACP methyl ester carboxylesterase